MARNNTADNIKKDLLLFFIMIKECNHMQVKVKL